MTDSFDNTSEYIPGDQDKDPDYYYGTNVKNWCSLCEYFEKGNYKSYYIIYLDIITDDMLDELNYNFNFDCIINLSYLYHDTEIPTVNVNLLLSKLKGIKFLSANILENSLTITHMPDTLETILDSSSFKISDLSNCCNMKSYKITNTSDAKVILPRLPNNLTTISINCYEIDGDSLIFPASVENIDITLYKFNVNISDWPTNLKSLNIHCNSNRDDNNTGTLGMLPFTLEDFRFYTPKYDYYLDLPSNLKSFKFICKTEYKYTLEIPDCVMELSLDYRGFPSIEKLPKACKKFKYTYSDDDVFLAFCKAHKRKGVLITK